MTWVLFLMISLDFLGDKGILGMQSKGTSFVFRAKPRKTITVEQ